MPEHVVIRADGGRLLGLGHLKRCMTLGKALRESGYDVAFIRTTRQDGLLDTSAPFPTHWLEDSPLLASPSSPAQIVDADATLATIGPALSATAWVVVDHYMLGAGWEERVRARGPRVLAIDDFRDRPHCADVLVSDSSQPFATDCADRSVQLVGPEYALIDDDFSYVERAEAAGAVANRILVTFGGSDPTGETGKVLTALSQVRARHGDLAVDVVIGAANAASERIQESTRRLPWATAHLAPSTLAPLMKQADLVITAGGNTMGETLSLRTPCLVIVTAANQQLLVDELARRDAIVVARGQADTQPETLANAIVMMLDGLDEATRRLRTTPVFDHLGARRVSAALRRLDATRPPPAGTFA